MNDAYRDYLLEGEKAGLRYHLGSTRKNIPGRVGLHQGTLVGSSMEFKEHRLYEPGDDLRHVDWNAYARSDQLTVKQFHEEVSPHLDVLIDGSRSMALPDPAGGSAKARATLALAALVATAGDNAGFSHHVWLAGDGCRAVENGGGRAATWAGIALDHPGSPADSFAKSPPRWRPRSVRFLLSDLLWNQEPVHLLAPCAEGATSLVVVQVLARADARPEHLGHIQLIDAETGARRELRLDESGLRRYRDNLARHQQNWDAACRRLGALMVTVIAEEFVGTWQLDELIAHEVLNIA